MSKQILPPVSSIFPKTFSTGGSVTVIFAFDFQATNVGEQTVNARENSPALKHKEKNYQSCWLEK